MALGEKVVSNLLGDDAMIPAAGICPVSSDPRLRNTEADTRLASHDTRISITPHDRQFLACPD